jgi:hypothetical protein
MVERGKLPADMIKVIASSLRQLQRGRPLGFLTNDQQFVDARVKNKKLVIKLRDK